MAVSHRQIERTMGLSTGYLSRIFSGKVVLRLEHILGVCDAIGFPPGAFFEAVYPYREFDRDTVQVVEGLQSLIPAPETLLPSSRKSVRRPNPSSRAYQGKSRELARARMISKIVALVMTEMGDDEDDSAES